MMARARSSRPLPLGNGFASSRARVGRKCRGKIGKGAGRGKGVNSGGAGSFKKKKKRIGDLIYDSFYNVDRFQSSWKHTLSLDSCLLLTHGALCCHLYFHTTTTNICQHECVVLH